MSPALVLRLSFPFLLVTASLRSLDEPHRWIQDRILAEASVVRAGRELTPQHWPEGARVVVCLSFDADNETLALRRGETAPVPAVWLATAEQIAR